MLSGNFDNVYRYSISWLLIRYEYNMLSDFHDLTLNCQLCMSNQINIFLPEIAKCNQGKYQNNKWYRIPNHFKHPTHVSDVQFDLKSLIISLVDVIFIFCKESIDLRSRNDDSNWRSIYLFLPRSYCLSRHRLWDKSVWNSALSWALQWLQTNNDWNCTKSYF